MVVASRIGVESNVSTSYAVLTTACNSYSSLPNNFAIFSGGTYR